MRCNECCRKIMAWKSECEGGMKFIVRVLIGLFFVISGGYKLFDPSHRQVLYDTLVGAQIPLPELNVYFVALVEFLFGLGLMIGFFASISSFILGLNMFVALFTVQIRMIPKSSPLLWIANFLYTPEVLLILILGWLLFSGPGKGSIDHWVWKKCSTDKGTQV